MKAAKSEMGGKTSSAVVNDIFVVVGLSGALYEPERRALPEAMAVI